MMPFPSQCQMIMSMRTLYQKCKLVHGDLSEYNILYYEASFCFSLILNTIIRHIYLLLVQLIYCVMQGHLYIIDVSQSVDLDHPHALDFLREDCIHVSVRASQIIALGYTFFVYLY